jgi:ribosomal protein S18 acetylase RimI-like enzyme
MIVARVLRGDAVFGARDAAGRLVGVATTKAPGDRAAPPSFAAERKARWRELGDAARARYDAFAAASDRHKPGAPHLYLNMLGVRSVLAGQGIGRRLLDAVHAHSRAEPGSAGVALSTEDPANVALYEHVGYRVLGRERVAPELQTWALWRPDEA